jgi:DNA-binding transcriptional LysR family regulator
MQTSQIHYFLALLETRNFTRAAERCGISQPSLTNAIKRLERTFGGRLFCRDRKNIELTDLGRAVQPYLEQIDQNAANAKHEAEKFLKREHLGVVPVAQSEQINRIRAVDVSDGWHF